VILKLYSNF